jgi:hypothetical protein
LTAPQGWALQWALVTSYDRPDERLLVEYMLPGLLGITRAAGGEGRERDLFLVEMAEKLERLRGRLAVVSGSAGEEDPAARPYPWLWRLIRHCRVGARGQCSQHAKIWLLHWRDSNRNEEHLQLVVSSANLTLSSFREQLQAAWHCTVRLERRTKASALRSWGVLPLFLKELATHCGEDSIAQTAGKLLGRANCPPGVEFVASVPGIHPRSQRWGMNGLRALDWTRHRASQIRVLTPFVGAWTAEDVGAFTEAAGSASASVGLCWIPNSHAWSARWVLPSRARDEIYRAGGYFMLLPEKPEELTGLFYREYRGQDPRWPHLKLYHFASRSRNRLLVTSANFSPAAWGSVRKDGSLKIDNFEFGVLIDSIAWPLPNLIRCTQIEKLAVQDRHDETVQGGLWADASWDGTWVHLAWRVASGEPARLSVTSGAKGGARGFSVKGSAATGKRRLRWQRRFGVPAWLVLKAGRQALKVPVFDDRRGMPIEASAIPDIDEETYRELCDQLLFEQYEGPVASDLAGGETGNGAVEPSPLGGSAKDEYGVDALVFARDQFRIVDAWAEKFRNASDTSLRELLRRDGENLRAAFLRRAEAFRKSKSKREIGSRVAADELDVRLRARNA